MCITLKNKRSMISTAIAIVIHIPEYNFHFQLLQHNEGKKKYTTNIINR